MELSYGGFPGHDGACCRCLLCSTEIVYRGNHFDRNKGVGPEKELEGLKEGKMRKTTRVVWLEKQQFVGIGSSKHSVVLSSQDDENGTGISPSDLLMLSLAGCTSYDVVSILYKKRQQLTGLQVTVTAEQDEDAPWIYRKMHVHYEVRGKGLREKAVQDAIELSETKYCSVAATLRETVCITYEYTIAEDE
jgi:putative redox protein